MSRMRYRWMSRAERDELWTRWKRGESASAIARALGRTPAAIARHVHAAGGIAAAPRRRAPGVLQSREREIISRGVARRLSVRAIARQLGRAPSTISREIRRHGGRARYRASQADQRAWRAARRPKACRLAARPRLRRVVAAKLAAKWSPRQIAGWLPVAYPDDATMRVSHETIYRSLFVQARGVLKQALIAHLRRGRSGRRPAAAGGRPTHSRIPDLVSIRQRPPSVDDRAVPGHWEGDLLAGAHHTYIATLVERQSRYVQLVRVPRKDTATVVRALTRSVRRLPAGLMQTLTWDRGTEMADHRRFTLATEVQVYFCDPQSPWQRGSNENTNGLLRQYFPKGTDLSAFSQAQLNRIGRQLNTRPRATLNFHTPAATLAGIVASTG
jgi:IS30 family transposase